MATAFSTSRPTETTTMSGANDMPSRQLRITALRDGNMIQTAVSSPQPSPRTNLSHLPPPNPPFVFPVQPSSSSAPPSFSRATGRRPHSAIELPGPDFDFTQGTASPQSRSPALPDFRFNPSKNVGSDTTGRPSNSPLPNFSFNPGATLGPDESLLSPPLSPPSPMSPVRNGHRRGGSEFVGGKLKAGETITVMSTSPTRSESGFASPKLSPADAHPRRGHAHRRSGAISSHDLTMILKPNNSTATRGSSAPTSPVEFGDNCCNFPEPNVEAANVEPVPQQTNEKLVQEVHGRPASQSDPSLKTSARAKVGFSDTLEFIPRPRPTSMVSTDTSSTMTVRPGHKVSGSISSILSGNLSSVDRDPSGLTGSPASRTKSDSRPSTAGAVLERSPSLRVLNGESTSPRRRNSIPLLMDLPKRDSGSPANSSPTKTPRRWSFFGLDPFTGAGFPTKSRSASSSSSGTVEKKVVSEKPPPKLKNTPTTDNTTSRSNSKKASGRKKKQKKVKSWAGSILTRKSKSRVQRSKSMRRRSQTPTRDVEYLDDDLMDVSQAPITPVVLITEPTQTESEADLITSKPSRMPDDDASYPMIDLDAALGPFNTPFTRDPQWEEAQRAGAPPKRQLHSAVGLRGFSGPGMHYHRRAESAPEMPPFEAVQGGIHRFGSSSTMADVFEEEEEEEDDENLSAKTPSEASATEAQDGSMDDSDSTSNSENDTGSTPTQEHELGNISPKNIQPTFITSTKRKGSGSSLEMQRPGSRMRSEHSPSGLREEIIAEEPSYVTSRYEGNILGTPETFSSGAPSPRTILSNEVDPFGVNGAVFSPPSVIPTTPYAMSYSSSFPSPRSPMSYDAHRISTAPSSINDENTLHSLLMGEPGPEVVRMSIDVPSLTSSNSTMTRESSLTPGVRPRNMPFHDQRPASFTSAFGRRRSSLASLSRLISSAHGERSKLSMEVPLETEPEKKPKVSKSRRLSRMMQFWKPKGAAGS
ncbi:hypothetical protein F4804DRAFT_297172 [Jackrogersella minutella]|nr:hypothetical protein F4804DRAFT_297172 [Jackrogersella minutella]